MATTRGVFKMLKPIHHRHLENAIPLIYISRISQNKTRFRWVMGEGWRINIIQIFRHSKFAAEARAYIIIIIYIRKYAPCDNKC